MDRDSDGDTKLEWVDGSTSSYINVANLMPTSESEWQSAGYEHHYRSDSDSDSDSDGYNDTHGSDGRPNCSGEHGLRAFVVPHSSFNCDANGRHCQGIDRGDTAYGCRRCNVDCCETCYAHLSEACRVSSSEDEYGSDTSNMDWNGDSGDDSRPNCPGEHGLRAFVSPGGFNCDADGPHCQGIDRGDAAYGCRLCDVDCCESCYATIMDEHNY